MKNNWTYQKLGEICKVIMGQSPPSAYYNIEKNGLPFYQGKAEFGDIYPTAKKWCNKPLKIAEKNDILISVRAPVGPVNICNETSCIGRGLAAIRYPFKDAYKFIFYYLKSIESQIAKIGTGSTFSAISKAQIENLMIPLPPLSEQKRIVAKIEELFTRLEAGVEALKKVKAQIRRYRQAVLKYAFEGKLTEEWRKNNPSLAQSGDSEKLEKDEILLFAQNDRGAYNENIPELPEGWRWVKLGEILSPSKEKINPLKSEPLPYIGLEHIERDTGKIIGRGSSTTVRSSKNKFYAGDLLYGKLRPYLNKVCVPDFDGVCSTDVLVFSKKTDLSNKYVLYRLLCGDFVRFANQKVSGVQHPRVDLEKIAVFYIPLPPLPEHQIVEEIERRFSVIGLLTRVLSRQKD